MRIKTIISQHRRDFRATYVCEHCNAETESGGYDDEFFHTKVIPKMECTACGKTAAEDYQPLAPKYPAGMSV